MTATASEPLAEAEWDDIKPGDRVVIVIEATLVKVERDDDGRGPFVMMEYDVEDGDRYAIEVPRYGHPLVKVEVDYAHDGRS